MTRINLIQNSDKKEPTTGGKSRMVMRKYCFNNADHRHSVHCELYCIVTMLLSVNVAAREKGSEEEVVNVRFMWKEPYTLSKTPCLHAF